MTRARRYMPAIAIVSILVLPGCLSTTSQPLALAESERNADPAPIGQAGSDDGVERPDPSKILADRRGPVVISTPSEAAAAKRQKAALMKEIEAQKQSTSPGVN